LTNVADEKSARKASAFTTDFQQKRKTAEKKRERERERERVQRRTRRTRTLYYNAKVPSRELVKRIRRLATARKAGREREREGAGYIE